MLAHFTWIAEECPDAVLITNADGRSEERLRKRADAAIYAAKRAGGNCCRLLGDTRNSATGTKVTP